MQTDILLSALVGNGYAPSIRDICTGTGLTSTETVSYYLQKLEKVGLIEVKKNSPRAIRLVGYELRKVRG